MVESSCESRRTRRTLSLALYFYLSSFRSLLVSSHKISRERDGKRELSFVLARLPFFSTCNDRHVVTTRTYTCERIYVVNLRACAYMCFIYMVCTGNLCTPGFVGTKRKAARSIFIEFQNSVCTYPAKS